MAAPGSGGRTSSSRRSASSRRSTRTTRSSRSPSHSRRTCSATSSSTPAISYASTAAPRRIRERDRLPSRSAATRNGADASGSSSATHAPAPVRSWNWPWRRRPASRSGKPASSSSPVRSGSTESRSNRQPTRRAMSAARSRTRRTAARSARSSLVCPHTIATRRARSAGSASVPAAQHVALVDEGGDHARRGQRGAGDDARQPRVERERNHRPPDVGEARRPLGVAPRSIAPSSVSSSSAARHARVGGGSTNAARRVALPMPPARGRGRRGRRRGSRRCGAPAGCRARSATTAGRHTPGSVRPARPARCSAESRLIDTVASRVMPVPVSKRGARARPPSTTMRTPSTVSDVSAMSVASTTRRRPGGDGARARSCSSAGSAPASGRTSTSAGTDAVRRSAVRVISPMPGRNTSTSPGCVAQRQLRRRWRRRARAGRSRWPRQPADVDRVQSARRSPPPGRCAIDRQQPGERRRCRRWPTSPACAGRDAASRRRRARGRGRGRW